MANLFNCLCSSLLSCHKNRELFYKGEGLELMNLILKEKRHKDSNSEVRVFACKVLNHCMSTEKPDQLLVQCCNKFIEILGLRVLMPIFQKPSSILGVRRKKRQSAVDEVEEHTLSIILALLRFCKPENMRRIVNKFVELDMVKTERLVELYLKYTDRLEALDRTLRREGHDLEDAETRDTLYPRRMEGGLFHLQLICHIILILANQEEARGQCENKWFTIKERIRKLLSIHANVGGSSSVSYTERIKSIATEYAAEKAESEANELTQLVNGF